MGGSPALLGLGQFRRMQCLFGRVNLFRFLQPPAPGSVIGELTLPAGLSVPLVETAPVPFGGPTLSAVDGQCAAVCGVVRLVEGRPVLDVRAVSPFPR